MPENKNILVIEDTLDTRTLYKKALELENSSVIPAADGEEGLESLKTGPLL